MSRFELVRLAYHEVEASPGFAAWLAGEGINVGLTCGGRLFFVGVGGSVGGSVAVTECTYGLCSALTAAGPDTLYLATRFQIWRLENALPPGETSEAGHDRLFVPQAAWTTGLLGVHDLALDGDGRVVFANSRFSCLSRTSDRVNFDTVWVPPFVSALAPEDRCHLTGVAMADGRPAFVTCGAATDTAGGWREHERDGGVVVGVAHGDIVCAGLSMPHSPRLDGDRLWLTNGGAGELGFVDLGPSVAGPRPFTPVATVPGLARGLARHGRYALVGCSGPPKEGSFDGLAVGERLAREGVQPACGVFVVDVEAGHVAHWLVLHGVPELHDVAVVAATSSAAAVSIQGDDVEELVTIPCPPA